MKLAIYLQGSQKAKPFHPGDQVRGELEICGRVSKQLPIITATFRGRVRVCVGPRGNTPPEYVTHILFEESQQIKLSNEISPLKPTSGKSKDQPQPVHSAPFEFVFPSASSYCPCQLPPSLNIASSSVRIKVEYFLVMAVRRHILGRVTRTTTVQQELSFRADPGFVFLPSSTIGRLPANKLCPKMNKALQDADKSRCTDRDWLPPYTPSLQVEVVLTSPPVLTRGCVKPIRILLHIPPELLQGKDIYLRGVVVQLRSSVTTAVGTATRNCAEVAHCWSSRGRVHLDKRRFELDSGAWGNCIIMNARPTCTSCVLDLTHSVQVIVGISRGENGEIQYIQTSLDVLVMGPPPSYIPDLPIQADTLAEDCTDQD